MAEEKRQEDNKLSPSTAAAMMYPPILRQALFSKKQQLNNQALSTHGRTGIKIAKGLLAKSNGQLKFEIQTRARDFYNGVDATLCRSTPLLILLKVAIRFFWRVLAMGN
jgi:hypothetical protein